MTRFTKQAQRGATSLAEEAVTAALADARLEARDVGAIFCGNVTGGAGNAQRALQGMPFSAAPIVNVENACASATGALHEAYAWVAAGLCDVALAVGVEVLSSRPPGPLERPAEDWLARCGMTIPAWYALKARRHMAQHDLSPLDLALVAVKSRRLAAHNPVSHFRGEVTPEEVLGARMIADPLTLHQCCPKTDGAAAAVVCSAEVLRRRGLGGAWIRGFASGSGRPAYTDEAAPVPPTVRVAARAYADAGVGPHDLDVVELHDAFSIGEVVYAEELGLCAAGDGARYAASGASSPDGDGVAVNPSGGLLSRGHPLGATGLAQVVEVVTQLRGGAGVRQRQGARLGLVHTMGATEFELDTNICEIAVLEAA